jgi:LDH2 family malate/lactate/ureidoglycolate dehydrogenase
MTTATDTKPADTAQGSVYARVEAAEAFGRRLLVAHGLSEQDGATMAGCLVRADLRGVDTHGLQFLPQYLDRVRRGLVNPKPDLAVERITPMVGSLDGQNGYGFVVATKAMAAAIDIAREFGVGVVSARNSTHFGMAACYTLQALEAGFISFVFTNASRAMPPWGGREAFLGTSPFAAAAPAGSELPFDLDMSPAVAARGKIRRAARRGEKIPIGYAFDAQGRPTTDPNAALDGGVVLPIGGPKGSGISMLMDIMGGVISGAACAGDVGNQFLDYDRPQNVGHFFLAMKPDLFIPKDEYLKRMDTLVQRVHAIPPAEGVEEILMPGERERRFEATRRRTGLPYHPKEVAALQKEAAKAGLPSLPVSPTPFESNTP